MDARRKAIEPVEQLPTWLDIRGNWPIQPRGDDEDRAAVEQAAAILSAEHPYIESQGIGPGIVR